MNNVAPEPAALDGPQAGMVAEAQRPALTGTALHATCMDNLLACSEESIYFKDSMSRFLLVSRKFHDLYTGGRDACGLTDADLFSPEHASEAFNDEQEIMRSGEAVVRKLERETFWDAPDEWVESTKMALRDANGQVIGTFGITRNVTHEYRAMTRQAALARVGDALAGATSRQAIYQALLDGALSLLLENVSRAAVVTTGGLAPEVVASTPEPPDHQDVLRATSSALEELTALAQRPHALRRDNLLVVPVATPRQGDDDDAPSGSWLGALVLESPRDLSEHSLQALTWLVSTSGLILDSLLTARRLRSLIARASDGLLVVSPEGRVHYGEGSLERFFGYCEAQLRGRDLADLVHPGDIARLREAISPLTAVDDAVVEVRWRNSDGGWRMTETTVVDLRADPEVEGVALSIRDVTEQKSLEMELRRGQKMQAIGQLAGGVAHEINTPVQFIADNLQFLQEAFEALQGVIGAYKQQVAALPSGVADREKAELGAFEERADLAFFEEEVPKAVNQALEGSQRVAKIVRALKAFGHPDHGEPVPTDLNDSLRNTVIVARGETKYVADITEDLGELPAVTVVPGDIGQVFLNLIVNAAHAIGDKVAGTDQRGNVTIKTWREGEEAVVTVSDDGAGIKAEVAEHIFEPFFTTKEVGRGTGQGLALARAVVERHGGTIRFESSVGQGTTFFIRLPLHGAVTEAA